ncbi:MAG: hypothetical protein PHR68_03855 [Candidatus Gracilibacteria bacterium]|nr:hypothetical protein [Candidatus Gracilibacteria bacterium]
MIDIRTRNNALSSYLLIGICATFFFVKGNPSLDNDFVKSHTKTALLLQLFLVITWFLFIHLSLFSGFNFLNYGLNEIISIILFLFIFAFMLYGIYKASSGEYFTIKDFGKITRTKDLIELNEGIEMNEKDKMTLILSHIPFIGFIVYGKYYEFRNSILDNITKLNNYSSFLIIFIYILGYHNIANIFLLFYILYIVYSSVLLVVNGTIINLNLKYLPETKDYILFIKTLGIYLKNYFTSFRKFSVIKEEIINENNLKEKEYLEYLNTKKELKVSPYLIYFPILNILFLLFKGTKYENHIKNGFSINLFLVLIFIFNFFGYISFNLALLLIFPIVWGRAYIKRLEYKIPVLRDFYEMLENIINSILELLHLAKNKHKEEKEISFKID